MLELELELGEREIESLAGTMSWSLEFEPGER
jgi:hypothetical protein